MSDRIWLTKDQMAVIQRLERVVELSIGAGYFAAIGKVRRDAVHDLSLEASLAIGRTVRLHTLDILMAQIKDDELLETRHLTKHRLVWRPGGSTVWFLDEAKPMQINTGSVGIPPKLTIDYQTTADMVACRDMLYPPTAIVTKHRLVCEHVGYEPENRTWIFDREASLEESKK